jgi:hexulose-6-phosphate isomerase
MKYGVMEGFQMHHSQREYGLKSESDRLWLINKAGELGFHGVELGIGLDYRHDPLWTGDSEYLEAIKEEANLSGIEIASICLHLLNYLENSPASNETGHRENGCMILKRALDVCSVIGAPVILVPFFGTALLKSEKQIDFLIEETRILSSFAEDKGVNLGLETSLNAPSLGQVIESIGSDYVGAYFDTGNAASLGFDVLQEIEELGKLIVQVHVKDTPFGSLGEGKIDFVKVFDALRKVMFDGYLMLETPSSDDSVKAASINLDFIKHTVQALSV